MLWCKEECSLAFFHLHEFYVQSMLCSLVFHLAVSPGAVSWNDIRLGWQACVFSLMPKTLVSCVGLNTTQVHRELSPLLSCRHNRSSFNRQIYDSIYSKEFASKMSLGLPASSCQTDRH